MRIGWAWLQRPCWFVAALLRALAPARFSFLTGVVGGALFLFVQQGTEILRSLAEQDQDTGRLNQAHIAWFFGALLVWSIQSWYWARVLLNFQFPGMSPLPGGRQGKVIRWCRREGPRLLGVLPPLLIAAAFFFLAPQGYDDTAPGDPKGFLRLFGCGAILMAALLYGGLWARKIVLRRIRAKSPFPTASTSMAGDELQPADGSIPRYRHLSELRRDGWAWWGLVAFAVFSACLALVFLIAPVQSGLALGSGAILCLAAASWVCFGSMIVWFSDRLRLPFIGMLVAWAVLCSLWNDNHLVRTIERPPVPASESAPRASGPVAEAFTRWQATLPENLAPALQGRRAKPVRPVFIVATEGGGIRAAYWTALVLASLEDRSKENGKAWMASHPGQPAPPDFVSHLFAVSGVSGGSLGAAVFNALLAENAGYPLAPKAGYMLRQDFLSPTLAAMLFPDLLQRFWPWPIAAADRARALETGWEHGWALAVSGDKENRFAGPFLALWSDPNGAAIRGVNRLPALFLNGTRVESGKRIITSNLPIASGAKGEFADAEDAEQAIGISDSERRDFPVSTAAHMSARFTYVSPAGRLPGGGHVVDGGYFENSGATTALEVLEAVQGAIDQHPEWPVRLVPAVIEIRNGPTSEPPGKGASPAPTPAPGPGHDLLGELLDPLDTLLNTRDARGSFSQAAIETAQQEMRNPPPWPALFRFGLYESKVPLPLGWMLSGGAAREMQRQLRQNPGDEEAMTGITQILLPPAP